MLNYLKSEIYRILHSKSSYLFIAICSLLLVSSNVLLAIIKHSEDTFQYANTAFSIANVSSSFTFVFLLCMMVAGNVFNNEHNNHTFKNCVSYGITRGTIYFGKLIIQFLYSIIAFAIIIGLHVASAYLLLEHSNLGEMNLLFETSVAVLPLLFFALATANCFYFIIEGTGGAVAATCGIIIAIPTVFNFLGMKFEIIKKISNVLPWNLLNTVDYDFTNKTVKLFWDTNGSLYYWIAGMLQMLLFVILGFVLFNRQEIK